MQIKSIDARQAARVASIMALVGVALLTYPLAAAAYLMSVHLPHKHFMILLFVPLFYAVANFFLVGFGCMLYNFAARVIGGIRLDLN